VRRHLRGSLQALAGPTLAVVTVAIFLSGHLELALRVYVLVVCGIALAFGVLALRDGAPAERPLRENQRAAPGGRRPPPPSLARLEHEAALGVSGSFDLHFRFVPRLRAIAAGLLEFRRRIALDTQPEAARAALGADTWGLVRPDRPAPSDRLGPGLSSARLEQVVDSLEAL
jgi:hypothetical protein